MRAIVRSLFFKIFVSFWIAMTLISAGFALIYVATSNESRWERWQSLHFDAFRQRVREEAGTLDPADATAVPRLIEALSKREPMVRIFAVADDETPRADLPLGAQNLGGKALAAGEALQERGESVTYFAAVLDPRFPKLALVEELRRPSPVLGYIGPDTLPFRLLVLLAVSGLVCYGLARQLTRRLHDIRRASRRLAEGDLAVRIAPQLGALDDEATALARDLDQMAERIDALLGAQQRLLRDVSHELRSPLARLTIALELARQEAKGDAAEYHDRIAREAELLGQLIGEILTLTRLEGEAKAQRQADALDLSELVREVAEDADFEARPSQRRVEVISDDRITLQGYAEILRRAVENVVRNAVRFAPVESSVEVRLERALVAGRPVARLDVRDRGPGVPDGYLEEIFQPFFRVSESRDRRSGGTGVGLAITERAVRLHGGSVMARNADGGGLIVSIALPLAPTDAAAL
jgi:two-component system sensor histidine kinase CpxA